MDAPDKTLPSRSPLGPEGQRPPRSERVEQPAASGIAKRSALNHAELARADKTEPGDEDSLYVRRIGQLYGVLCAYGLVALVIDLVQSPLLRWGNQVYWPRILALCVVGPLALGASNGWIGVRLLRATEVFVYVGIVAEACTETILSAAPMFAVDAVAIVLLFLRASFIPSGARAQAKNGAFVTLALAVGAWIYMTKLGRDTSPFFASASGDRRYIQVGNILLGGTVFVAITSYASHTIHALRTEVRDARRLGQYLLEERIGEGGMGEVWRGRHALLQRPTAVKVVRGNVSEELAIRFEREVRAAAQLSHASSVAIYDFGVSESGRVFYAMELLRGLTLEQLVERGGPMPAERVAALLDPVLGVLAEAHELGLVHRDVKPANVMVIKNGTEHDFPKLLDFGLVHLRRREPGTLALTQKGALAGTPLYMAPETITGDVAPDGRTDLYAVGAVAYFLLTGEPPFAGANATVVMLGHVTKRPVPPSEKSELGVPADLEAVVLRALEKRPEQRFADASEMRAALRACACWGQWTEERAREFWRVHAPEIG